MEKILITGGAGYIGSHVAVALIEAGYEVVIADNYYNCNPSVISSIELITGEKVHSYDVDVTNKKELEFIFQRHHISAVCHCAGYKSVAESVEKPLMYYSNNIGTTLVLLEIMQKYSCKHIVFSSSATVYGDNATPPFSEEMPTGCANPYGWSKLMIEQIISDFVKANKGFSAVLLRYFNPIGAHDSGLIGENPKDAPNNLMPHILKVAAGENDCLAVYGNDYDTIDGTGVRDYIHVLDLAEGHIKAIEYALESMDTTEIVNLGSGKGYSVLELIKAFEKVNQVCVPYEIACRRNGDVALSYADIDKAQRILDWEPKRDIETMCKDAWKYYSSINVE